MVKNIVSVYTNDAFIFSVTLCLRLGLIIFSVGFLGDRKPLSFLKKRAFVGARKIKTAIKDDPDKVYMPTREVERPGNHPGTSFEGL